MAVVVAEVVVEVRRGDLCRLELSGTSGSCRRTPRKLWARPANIARVLAPLGGEIFFPLLSCFEITTHGSCSSQKFPSTLVCILSSRIPIHLPPSTFPIHGLASRPACAIEAFLARRSITRKTFSSSIDESH